MNQFTSCDIDIEKNMENYFVDNGKRTSTKTKKKYFHEISIIYYSVE